MAESHIYGVMKQYGRNATFLLNVLADLMAKTKRCINAVKGDRVGVRTVKWRKTLMTLEEETEDDADNGQFK